MKWLRFLLGRASVAALVICAAGVFVPPALGHVPFLEPDRSSGAPAQPGNPFPGAIPVPDAAISRAIYGTLAEDAAFDAWLLRVSSPATTPVEMLVPKAAEYEEFRPSFALVGEGLTTAGETPAFIADRLAVAFSDGPTGRGGVGIVTVPDPGTTPRPTFYEPFSFTRYFEGGKTSVDLKPGRTYYLVVYDPAGDRGEYALGVGRAERFTALDAASSVVAVLRIKLGLYGQGAFHVLPATVLAVVVIAIIAAIALVVRRGRGRRKRPAPPAPGRAQ